MRRRRRTVACLGLCFFVLYGSVIVFMQSRISRVVHLPLPFATIQHSSGGLEESSSLMAPSSSSSSSPSHARHKRSDNQNEINMSLSHYNSYARPAGNYQTNHDDLWEAGHDHDVVVPEWMKQYFRWHKQQLIVERQSGFTLGTTKILIVSCLPKYARCGGFADRVFALPFLIRVAAETNRLLLFQWGRPAELEEFLLPPIGGHDWRVPFEIRSKPGIRATNQESVLKMSRRANARIVRVLFQSSDHGEEYYNQHLQRGEVSFQEVFRSCWDVVFTPVAPLARRIKEYLQQQALSPGHYTSAHFRALYQVKERDSRLVRFVTQNAVNCTSHYGHTDVFFASDSAIATDFAAVYGKARGIRLVSAKHENNPLHFDKTTDWRERPASDFYDAIVELYILSRGRCVLYGMGGYGRLASFLSRNASCALQHHAATGVTRCNMMPTSPAKKAMLRLPEFANGMVQPNS